MADKVFLNCSAKQKTFGNGGSQLLIGVKAAGLIAFAEKHVNARGYLNLVISERRTPGKYGETHSVTLDDFVPTRRAQADGEEPPF